jgi:hypothetical protein
MKSCKAWPTCIFEWETRNENNLLVDCRFSPFTIGKTLLLRRNRMQDDTY